MSGVEQLAEGLGKLQGQLENFGSISQNVQVSEAVKSLTGVLGSSA